jgi:HD-GYP domain-containing protein (c-di-GMP phosphodiesterase class II)
LNPHPQSGYNILKNLEFPWPVAQAVLQHHERLDGSGYPQGLPDEEIIVEARIVMVADVVEAMASHRPYRSALGLEEALAEITANRGRLYCKEAVDACLSLFIEKGFRFEA